MWKLLSIASDGGNASLFAFLPIFARILTGPIFFYYNFFDGLVVLMLRGNNHTMSTHSRCGLGFLCRS